MGNAHAWRHRSGRGEVCSAGCQFCKSRPSEGKYKNSNDHQTMYTVEGEQFGICTHHKGAKQIKRCYVKGFLAAMSNIGWYED